MADAYGTLSQNIIMYIIMIHYYVVADPGFPVGGRGPRTGERGPPRWYIMKILYVKTKESGPIGGRAPGTPP